MTGDTLKHQQQQQHRFERKPGVARLITFQSDFANVYVNQSIGWSGNLFHILQRHQPTPWSVLILST